MSPGAGRAFLRQIMRKTLNRGRHDRCDAALGIRRAIAQAESPNPNHLETNMIYAYPNTPGAKVDYKAL